MSRWINLSLKKQHLHVVFPSSNLDCFSIAELNRIDNGEKRIDGREICMSNWEDEMTANIFYLFMSFFVDDYYRNLSALHESILFQYENN